EGLTTAYFNRGAYRQCLEIRQEFLAISERGGELGSVCIAHRGLASIHNVFGNFATAHSHGERAWSLYGCAKQGSPTGLYVRDVGVSILCHLSIAEWHLGYLDQSRERLEASLALAKGSNHPNTIGYAHAWASVLSFMARDYGALQRHASVMTKF